MALKSSLWMLDPRPDPATIVDLVEQGVELSVASNAPVIMDLRIRACPMTGSCTARADRVTPHRGFTLLELLIVIAVIAILAALAVPSLQHRMVREQVLEALPLADLAKSPVAVSWAITQAFPPDNAAAGLPIADKIVSNLVSSVAVENGAIHVTFGNRANALLKGKIVTLRPAVVEDEPIVPVAWVCGFAGGPDKMTIKGVNKTSVPMAYLPLKCREG